MSDRSREVSPHSLERPGDARVKVYRTQSELERANFQMRSKGNHLLPLQRNPHSQDPNNLGASYVQTNEDILR